MNLTDAVAGFLSGYFSTCRRSEKTQAAYKIDLAQLRAHLGPTPLPEIKVDQLEQWAAVMQARGYASISIRRKFATAKVFFRYWVRRGLIERSPLWNIRLDLGRERVLPRNLPASDAKKMIEQVWRAIGSMAPQVQLPRDPRFLRLRDLAALEILFATGMRVGELVNLKLRDWIEDEASFVVNGKGSRQRLALLPDSRSLRALTLYLTCRATLNLAHEGILVNAAGAAISTQGVARLLAKSADAAGVTTRVTPHMIRHTVATLLLRNGADIRIVQEVLGHASIATTQRYTHISKEHLFSTLRLRHPNHHLDIQFPVPYDRA
jgi:integrase/recombinase XerD